MSQGMAPTPPKKEAASAPTDSAGNAAEFDQVFDLIFSSSNKCWATLVALALSMARI